MAVLAIALTAVLFTSLFTIALSINEGIQQNNFRQAGGWSHGTFKYLTEEQFQELKDDPLIESWGLRRFVGMPTEAPFNKSHVEIGYSDANQAHWSYCDPVEGRLPQEGTDEAATDTHVLELLGVEPEIGAEFTVTFDVDGHETTQTFTLSGWWEYDEAVVANHILIPESRADAILAEVGVIPPGSDGMTGSWNLDVMLKNGARSIASDLDKILANHGYQSDTPGETYISIGVNWGYTGAQLSDKLDPTVVAIIVGVLALILLTGYLIILQCVPDFRGGDIRFYGLLKTIGTTPRQLRRIIRTQALLLSLIGIPVGLLLGWLLGGVLTPVITAQLNGVTTVVSVSPLLFVGSAIFALVTVLISCRRPGRLAGKVSPVEAVRYTEGKALKRQEGTARQRSIPSVHGLGQPGPQPGQDLPHGAVPDSGRGAADRNRHLYQAVLIWTNMCPTSPPATLSWPMRASSRPDGDGFNDGMGVPEEVIAAVDAQGGITGSGRVYGKTTSALEFVTEEYYRSMWGQWNTQEVVDSMVAFKERTEDGLLADRVQLYGMEPFALDHLTVLEGDLQTERP